MPVTDQERKDIDALDASSRTNFISEQLKRIRENATGPAMNHEVVNDALDKIEVAQKKGGKDKTSTPASHIGETGGPSQNPPAAAPTNQTPGAKPVAPVPPGV